MMLPANDHVDSLFNSIRHAKHVLSPLELCIKNAAKDFENFLAGKSNEAKNSLQFVRGEVNVYGNTNGSMNQICYLKKVNGQCVGGDDRKKGLSIKLSIKTLMEILPQNVNKHKVDLLELWHKNKNGFQEEETCLNSLQLHKTIKESKGQKGEEVDMLSKWLVGSMFDYLTQNLQQKEESNTCDSALFPPRVNHFDHLKVITSVLEGKREDIGGFLRNLKFAKVGGFRSSAFFITLPLKEEDNGDGFNTTSQEEIGVSSPPKNPRNNKFEPVSVEKHAGSVLKSALAGGLSCAFSTALMHPIDTIKTHVQASTLSFPEIISKIPEIGAAGLYKGSTPAILGQFFGHGFRTGFFEASKIVLTNVAPSLANRQAESVLSFCSAVLGTVSRVPSEVVKQRLQAGVFDNLGEAIIGTWQQEGLKGFFRGTGATLCREVPFYVAGLGLYTESKKAVERIIGRELEPWETIGVGAITGGLTAVSTTPFDVIKTRMMISTQGGPVSMYMVALSILSQDGPLGLFKGAVPRFFWVAPLGAINFAGYELARKAMG